jgi:hypothetical protein
MSEPKSAFRIRNPHTLKTKYGRSALSLLALVLCTGAVLYVARPDLGHVEARVIEREELFMYSPYRNGTQHRVYMSDFSLVARPGTASIREEHSKPNAVEPNSEKTWVVNVFETGPVPRDVTGVVFLPPWTTEDAENAKSELKSGQRPYVIGY